MSRRQRPLTYLIAETTEATRQAWQAANERRAELAASQPALLPRSTHPPSRCHYCDNPADSRDHVVPRALLSGRHMAQAGNAGAPVNVVPACLRCNQRKGDKRSDCTCLLCLTAWASYGPVHRRIPVIEVRRLAWLEDYGDERR